MAKIVGVTDQLPSSAEGVAVSVCPATVNVTVPDGPTFVIPLIVGVELLISTAAPPVSVSVGGGAVELIIVGRHGGFGKHTTVDECPGTDGAGGGRQHRADELAARPDRERTVDLPEHV